MTVHHKDQCPCGSGKRYKHCHLPIHEAQRRRGLVLAAGAIGFLAVAAAAWALWGNRPKSPSATAGTTAAQSSAATPSTDAAPNAFGGVQPGVAGRSPTAAQPGTTVPATGGGALAPGENPKPWEYDVAKNRYYDPRPGHQHWHTGAPPADPDAPIVTTTTPVVTATTGSGLPAKISGASTVQVQSPNDLAPGENPKPYEYDAAKDRYFDPSPGHNHWHNGRPPAGAGAATKP